MSLAAAPNQRHLEMVARANASVDAVKARVAGGVYRQWYHLMPPAYWMNDPNGFTYYQGRYHLFYQHNPYAAVWGSMHWGHASSPDLVHWEHHPIALAPSEPYDRCYRGGIFSGTSVVVGDRLMVMYTAAVTEGKLLTQKQCLAWSDDGIHFEKFAGNPLIVCPPGLDATDFRDPKVWQHDGKWYCVVSSRVEGDACCAIFRSDDFTDWQYQGVLARGYGRLGWMWECPDFFPLGNKYVLQFSPMHFHDQKTVYLVGEMDYDACRFTWDRMGEIDAGFDFYGAQTMADPRGRRIMVGWQNGWDWMPWFSGFGAGAMENWCSCMSLPREVTLAGDGTLRYQPVAELETLRGQAHEFGQQTVAPGERCPLVVGDNIHFELEFKLDLDQTSANLIELHLRASDFEDTVVRIDLALRSVTFDRSRSDFCMKGVMTRPITTGRGSADSLTLRLFADTCSIELFTDEGRLSMDCNIYPEQASTDLYVTALDGAVVFSARGWAIERQ